MPPALTTVIGVSGELVPGDRDLLMSDADRERVLARLQDAAGEGRLTLDEFQERVDGVLRARRFGEVEPYLAGLPPVATGPLAPPPAPAVAELRTVASSLRRTGRWSVPRTLRVSSKAGSVKLDFTDALIGHPVVEIVLDVYAGSTTLVLPAGASVDVDGVQMYAGSVTVRRVPQVAEASGGPHFVVTGSQKAGGLTVRHQRRFLRWRW